MSTQVTTAFVKQFGTNVQLLSQQRGSVLRAAVRNETVVGEEAFYEQVGTTSATKKGSRHSDTPLMDTPFARRRVAVEDFDADLARRDFTQSDDRRLVAAGLDVRCAAQGQLTGAVGGGQCQLEAVGNELDAVVNSYAGHGVQS